MAPARSFGGDFFGRQRQEVRGHSLCIMTSLANFDEANPRGMAADDGDGRLTKRGLHGVFFFGIPLYMVSEKDAKGNVKLWINHGILGGSCKISQKLTCLRHFESLDDVEDVYFGIPGPVTDGLHVQTGDFPFVKC